ncbi:aspartate aminotransferase family protein [Thalassomonas haliotis]|uniref:Aminotransferase class III-fold pyridoxal phosphate-dependent enzyme n=1 Tax=Thalassomonas haliotis TaxID=485448 RepID=A0ABY7VCJ0_9GAMM|nr:aminotransferase class III-fold pyridoxal phosphate-dependent enzyme [Thalassomonas haliotis]WDE11122.1 aminotransferase class III-fold pyridoxal phosphate-dependent enzyme [Thalassomonas haliotis]
MNSEQVFATEQQLLSPGISEESRLAGVVFARGSGSYLFDLEGKAYLDFASGIFTQNVGHNHPEVVTQVKQQLDELWNVHDASTVARARACQALNRHLPQDLTRVAFFTTGAEAVEAAIRAVFAAAPPEKQRLAALRYGFHGKTQGARSLVHWDVGYSNQSGNSVLGYAANCYRCPLERSYPSCEMQCAKLVNKHISSKANIAALFFEPVQGAGGVIVPPPEYWPMIAEVCRENGILLVADEVISAGGRTGSFLACQHYGIEPDLVMAAKGLSSGFPFSVLAGREALMASGEFAGAGAASSTYGGNPMSCTAAAATLQVLENEQVLEGMEEKSRRLELGLRTLAMEHPVIGDVRGMGMLWAIEFVSCRKHKTPDIDAARTFYQQCLLSGVRTCLGGNIVRIGPPLNIADADLDAALVVFDACLAKAGAK